MADLDSNSKDRLVSVAKGVVGACPFVGPIASEAIGAFIPNQRMDRISQFLRELESDVRAVEAGLERFERHMQTEEGLDIFEEGLVQASRSVSAERKERLARLTSRSLTSEELKYAESRKLLNLFRELTDPEILWLVFYSMDPTLGRGPHSELVEKHPEVLRPVSRELGSPQSTIDRGALQDSYKNTLMRLSLVEHSGRSHQITSLGRLLVRYIDDENQS